MSRRACPVSVGNLLVILAALAMALPPAAFAADAAAQPDVEYSADVELRADYLSNLYNVPEEREDTFDSETGPGQRYDGMSGPQDIELRAAGEGTASRGLAKGRDLEAFAGASYSAFVDNSIANYLRLKAGTEIDVTPGDHLKFAANFIPDRFKKNYSVSEVVGGLRGTRYEHAYYSEVAPNARYMHDWDKNLATGLRYEYADRSFDNPFEARDRTTHSLALLVDVSPARGIDVALAASFAQADTPVESVLKGKRGDRILERDRSYQEVAGEVTIGVDLPWNMAASLTGAYSTKEYTTDVPEDALYYDRFDDTWSAGLELEKELGKRVTVFAGGSVSEKTSNRAPDAEDDEEVGYQSYAFGGGAGFSF